MYKNILNIQGNIHITGKKEALSELPPSYQQFAPELGYGLLCGLFIIYIPFDAPHEKHPDSLDIAAERMQEYLSRYLDAELSILEEEKEQALIKRAVPFGISENGHFLFWDRQNALPNGEWPIYMADFPVSITHVADSLHELIAKLTDTQTVRSVMQFNREALPKVFSPYEWVKY
ncbi:SMI1/KNR4 family protein [Chitinophaga sedimenti]|uniref:SMI1/KNR4 family protein n=1 Tax=Chitinophaga sedimenti TaxID=2033606 RepID=UPI0020046830|nr:SMI1/KNR4 family protein [Chitinophaga sedimenti]MCK7557965.1 SMI1/KNR4 family protein [Chitinophaga sedimenti]